MSRSSGGSKLATKRMGSSRATAVDLISFLGSVRRNGAETDLRERNVAILIGRPIEESFFGLSDIICPDGGNLDQGIARNAFIETIAEFSANGITDLDSLTAEQMQSVVETFVTHAIEGRICNDIGIKIVFAPSDIDSAERIQSQLHDFISRSVSDSFNYSAVSLDQLTTDQIGQFVDTTYEKAFDILKELADEEAAQR